MDNQNPKNGELGGWNLMDGKPECWNLTDGGLGSQKLLAGGPGGGNPWAGRLSNKIQLAVRPESYEWQAAVFLRGVSVPWW